MNKQTDCQKFIPPPQIYSYFCFIVCYSALLSLTNSLFVKIFCIFAYNYSVADDHQHF